MLQSTRRVVVKSASAVANSNVSIAALTTSARTLRDAASSQPSQQEQHLASDQKLPDDVKNDASEDAKAAKAKQLKSVAESDRELMEKLERISGDGGVAGLELENGRPVAMKRGVRENMFRVI